MPKGLPQPKIDVLVALSGRFDDNWRRCLALFALVQDSKFTEPMTNVLNETGMDLIRATLVFFHATFEDVLREVCREFWLTRPPDKWKPLDFFQDQDGDRKSKLSIIDLAEFRGLTVDGLIQKWFDSWLERESYNNFTDVMSLFRSLDVEQEPFRKYHSHVDFLAKRRHRIVHNVDFEKAASTPAEWPTSDVYRFMIATFAVHSIVLELLRELGIEKVDFAPELQSAKNKALKYVEKAELQPNDQFPFV